MHKALFPWLPRYLVLGGLGLLSLPALATPVPANSGSLTRPPAESVEPNLYVVQLSAAPAVENGSVNPNTQAGLQQQQEDLLQQLYVRFAGVELHSRSKLLGNSITVKLTAAQAQEVSRMEGVKQISLASAALPLPGLLWCVGWYQTVLSAPLLPVYGG